MYYQNNVRNKSLLAHESWLPHRLCQFVTLFSSTFLHAVLVKKEKYLKGFKNVHFYTKYISKYMSK